MPLISTRPKNLLGRDRRHSWGVNAKTQCCFCMHWSRVSLTMRIVLQISHYRICSVRPQLQVRQTLQCCNALLAGRLVRASALQPGIPMFKSLFCQRKAERMYVDKSSSCSVGCSMRDGGMYGYLKFIPGKSNLYVDIRISEFIGMSSICLFLSVVVCVSCFGPLMLTFISY